MKTKAVPILILTFIFVLFPLRTSAQQPDIPIPQIALDLSDGELSYENSSEIFSFSTIIQYVFSAFFDALGEKTAFISQLFILLFALYLINSFAESFCSEKIVSAMSFAVVAVSTVSVFSTVFSSVDAVSEAFTQLSGFLSAMLPSFLTSLASAGYSSVASSGGGALFFSVEIISAVICGCLKPFSTAYICIGAASGISDNFNLKTLSSFIRNFIITSMSLVLTLFGGIMALQTTLSMTSDTLFKRTAKLAAGTFIPVFGGALGEGLETAFASAVVMKNGIGIFGTAVVFLTMLPSLCSLAADLIVVSVSCGVCGFFGNEKALAFFSVVRDCLAIVFTAAVECCLVLLIGISLLIKI
ncbi:MAG: hypothetical protein J6D42_05115 [Clostridia bacterium]|nr:hypothetical protein [Clostridia bacterium]